VSAEKDDIIKIRISKTKKQDWKKLCKERNLTLTDLLTASVENRILENERKQILAFIEKQDNVFIKIETNINQVAKIVNGQKFISESELKNFTAKLSEITKLKKQQNQIFKKIYEMLAK
jgi:mRNA-degrading endonuclease RelE of RelBE toxin-antitoxin system